MFLGSLPPRLYFVLQHYSSDSLRAHAESFLFSGIEVAQGPLYKGAHIFFLALSPYQHHASTSTHPFFRGLIIKLYLHY
jgi:hypothetical protein